MSIFGSIMSKIFGGSAHAESAGTAGTGASAGASAAASAAPATSGSSVPPGAGAGAGGSVDVEAVVSAMAAKAGQPLNWRESIVDLMKALGLDSSLQARKQLAQELHYTGSTDDSATMNVWLHKQVMRKLAENGGKVPEDLKS